jgi:hypothetical protein
LDDLGDVLLSVEWQAVAQPAQDYSVFVHVSHEPEIAQPGDILAQGDRLHPVYGFYPTSQWAPGQLVRDDYRIHVGQEPQPRYAIVGLYTIGADGVFVNELRQVVAIRSESGSLAPNQPEVEDEE